MTNRKSKKQIELPRDKVDEVISLYSSGNIQEAIHKIKELNENYPNVPLLFNILGACYKSLGQIDAAATMFKTAYTIKPDYAEAYSSLGIVLKSKFELDTALYEHLKKAFKIQSDPVNAIIDEKNNLQNNRDLEAARDSLEKAVRIKPTLAEARHLLASIN